MRILALMNQKGGVGKTTTTANLGAALARLGKKVGLIDVDPQAHLTINYGLEPASERVSLYDVLTADKPLRDGLHPVGENLSIVPSSIDLAGAEIELVTVIGRELLLKKAVEAANLDFDFLLMDCPPSLGILTINALSLAHEVLIPMQPQFLPLQGMVKLLETVQLVQKRMNPSLRVGGVVLTMFDAQARLSAEVVSEINTFFDAARGKSLPWSDAKIFKTRIRRNIKLAECPSFGQTIFAYDASSNGAQDYLSLAKELSGITAPPAAASAPAVDVTIHRDIAPRPATADSMAADERR